MLRRRPKVTQFPVMEEIDLIKTVSKIRIRDDFLFVKRIIYNIQWPANQVLFSTFGVDAALTNGLQLEYNDHLLLPHGIKTNAEFGETMYDVRIDTDATGVTKLNSLTARLSIWKFTKNGEGLRIDPDRQLFLVVQDDLSGTSKTHNTANVQGWRWI